MAGVDLGSIVAHLRLEMNDFNNNLNRARDQINNTDQQFRGLKSTGEAFTKVGGALTAGVTVPVMGIAASVVNTQMKFQDAMAKVQALSGASGAELKKLEDTAKQMGATTIFSASECADALGYMALAGWDANESAAGLPGVLNLAAASGMELAEASDMVTDYLTAFGLEADQAGRMADVLSYAQAHSNTTTQQLGEAFKNCAVNAHNAGMSLEETTALLGKLADSGLKGSEAGTALNAVIRDMSSKMKNGCIEIGNTKVAVQDANGNFRDMKDIIADVTKATDGMGDAEKTAALQSTFTADSIKAMGILCNTGADDIDKFTQALENSKGSAQKMSDMMNNTLSGSLKQLGSAWEALQLSLGDTTGPLSLLIGMFTKFLQALNKLPGPVKQFIVTIALIAAAVGPTLLIIGKMITSFLEIKKTIGILKGAFGLLKGSIGGLITGALGKIGGFITGSVIPALSSLWGVLMANPIILVIAAIAALVAAFIWAWNNVDGFKEFWINLWETVKQAAIDGWNAVVNFFTVSVPQWFNSVVQWFQQLPYKIAAYLAVAIVHVRKWKNDMITKAKEMGSKFISGVINFIKQLPSKIKTYFNLAVTYARKWLHDMTEKAKETGTKFINGIITFIKQLPGKLWGLLLSALAKVAAFVTQMGSKARQAASNFISRITSGLSGLGTKLWNIGKNAVQGLINGLMSGASALWNAAQSLASKAWNGMKSALGIHSPSKVMAEEVGQWIPKGVTVGIEANAGNTLKAIKDYAQSLVQEIDTNKFLGEVNMATSGININTEGSNNNNLVAALKQYTQAIIDNKQDIDYDRMGVVMGNAVAQQSNPIIMDKTIVGQKVASSVRRTNNYYDDQQSRFRGDKDYV